MTKLETGLWVTQKTLKGLECGVLLEFVSLRAESSVVRDVGEAGPLSTLMLLGLHMAVLEGTIQDQIQVGHVREASTLPVLEDVKPVLAGQ